jgi:hypothetical protein
VPLSYLTGKRDGDLAIRTHLPLEQPRPAGATRNLPCAAILCGHDEGDFLDADDAPP